MQFRDGIDVGHATISYSSLMIIMNEIQSSAKVSIKLTTGSVSRAKRSPNDYLLTHWLNSYLAHAVRSLKVYSGSSLPRSCKPGRRRCHPIR